MKLFAVSFAAILIVANKLDFSYLQLGANNGLSKGVDKSLSSFEWAVFVKNFMNILQENNCEGEPY